MGELTMQNLNRAMEAVRTGSTTAIIEVNKTEANINELEKMLTAFLVEVDNLSLTEHQHLIVKNMFYEISDIERVGDHRQNIAELVQTMGRDKIAFSKKGTAELEEITQAALNALTTAMDARRTDSLKTAEAVDEYENRVDALEDEFREKHIARLSKGKCTPENGVIFLDILSNLERIADHATNIAGYVVAEKVH